MLARIYIVFVPMAGSERGFELVRCADLLHAIEVVRSVLMARKVAPDWVRIEVSSEYRQDEQA